ncbi:MAG: DUF2203 family protein [Acidobacteriota bacterium]
MRYFRLDEAHRVLPAVEQHLRDALFHKAECERVHQQLEDMLNHVRMAGGSRIDSGRHQELRTQRDGNVRELQKAMTQIEHLGAVVKDLEIGLLDCMARYQAGTCACAGNWEKRGSRTGTEPRKASAGASRSTMISAQITQGSNFPGSAGRRAELTLFVSAR